MRSDNQYPSILPVTFISKSKLPLAPHFGTGVLVEGDDTDKTPTLRLYYIYMSTIVQFKGRL